MQRQSAKPTRRHYPSSLGLAQHFASPEDAQDAIQTAYLRAFRQLEKFRGKTGLLRARAGLRQNINTDATGKAATKQKERIMLPDKGMMHLRSSHSAAETLRRLEGMVTARGMTILARIDHSGDAAKAGLKMQPAQLVIFGNAKAGTPLMIAAPTLALDLPLKALVWEDAEGQSWLSFNTSEYLQERHGVPPELMGNIGGARKIFEEAARGE
jgi:uncharacterized protein (DUF302 family)